MAGISVDEMMRVVKVLERRWPGCTVGRPTGGTYHEVRDGEGNLLAAHEGLAEVLRLALALATREGA